MSVFKKLIASATLATAMLASPAIAQDNVRIALVVKALGIGLAMDDFGTGYSSLAYLSKFPFDTIKLDQSLVRNQWTQRDILLQSVISMATNLGLSTIAEGVEDENDLENLKLMGCQYIQGFVAGVPVSAEIATDLVRAQNPLVAKDDAAAE